MHSVGSIQRRAKRRTHRSRSTRYARVSPPMFSVIILRTSLRIRCRRDRPDFGRAFSSTGPHQPAGRANCERMECRARRTPVSSSVVIIGLVRRSRCNVLALRREAVATQNWTCTGKRSRRNGPVSGSRGHQASADNRVASSRRRSSGQRFSHHLFRSGFILWISSSEIPIH